MDPTGLQEFLGLTEGRSDAEIAHVLAVVTATTHHLDQEKENDMGNWFAGRQKSDPLPERDANGDRKFGWDGKTPNTDDDKRFYRNRESGYDGRIDQNGYRCDKDGKRTGGDS